MRASFFGFILITYTNNNDLTTPNKRGEEGA
jgi:hypothetical protein